MAVELKNKDLGFAGNLAKKFANSKLTPVIAIASILLGIFSVWLTAKEEEPQISVPMIDIEIPAPGLSPAEVERKVTEPIERGVWGLDGVEYVYSTSRAHGALITVRFKVGEPMEPSLVKVHHKLMTLADSLPPQVMKPTVKSFSIDDVPFLILTFHSKIMNDYDLRTLVAPLARELSATPDLGKVEMLGGLKKSVRIIVDPTKLKNRGVSLLSVAEALNRNDLSVPTGKNWSKESVLDVEFSGRLNNLEQIKNIALGQRAGSIVYLKDLAEIIEGPEERTRASSIISKSSDGKFANAVSIVFAKRKGTNVVDLAEKVLSRAEAYAHNFPSDVSMTPMRNYGETAAEKSTELIEHLIIATFSVSVLIAIFMGLRAAVVVAIAIPVTLALTLALYYFMGYTLNRVTLFALIFSIGILVDDAIVVVENIERHLHLNPKLGLLKATLKAVAEVGNPTILATFTVIAAILPMAFVRGLMGPYMKPIPVGASLAMMLSLFVAFIVTPWASIRLLKLPVTKNRESGEDEINDSHESHASKEGFLDRAYRKLMVFLLSYKSAFAGVIVIIVALLIGAGSLVYNKSVKVKMLPFDNKNEFQVLLDFPTSTPLSRNVELSKKLAEKLVEQADVEKIQIFAGEAAPFSFSGMVKHTFLRRSDYFSDLQVMLSPKNNRSRSSHEIIESLRPIIFEFSRQYGTMTKVLEIPPGPPVLATMLAEVYGPTEGVRQQVAREIYAIFANEPSVVDLDTSLREGRQRLVYPINRKVTGELGVSSFEAAKLSSLIFSETTMGHLAEARAPEEIMINLSIKDDIRSGLNPYQNQVVPSREAGVVNADRLVEDPYISPSHSLYRKNLKPVTYVMSELSGSEEAPVYGMLKIAPLIKYPTQTAEVPWDTQSPTIKWDGEWFITYEVFRDLGGAFAVVMVLIYILVLGWFRSFAVPLVIMAPIPISLIGILPGHYLMGAYFTATSMIGFIAGAGIIVRNSIILVDFIEQQIREGKALKEAVISAGITRFRPMLLTAAAVVVGSAVMLFDPIFQGLAISLMAGEVAATILSRFAVPVIYYWFFGAMRERFFQKNAGLGEAS